MTEDIRSLLLERVIRQVTLAHQRGDYGTAITLCLEALSETGNDAVTLNVLGVCLRDQGDLPRAVDVFGRAISHNPRFSWSYLNRGLIFLRLGRDDEAVSDFENVINIRPSHPARMHLGSIELRRQRFRLALNHFDEALLLVPSDHVAFNQRGIALRKLGKLEESLDSYERAIRLKPDSAEYHYNHGIQLRLMGRLEEAIQSLDRALSLRPDFPEAGFHKATLLLTFGRYREGWPLYELRWHGSLDLRTHRKHGQRPWLGDMAIAGKTIFVHGEQGLGDRIQMARYILM